MKPILLMPVAPALAGGRSEPRNRPARLPVFSLFFSFGISQNGSGKRRANREPRQPITKAVLRNSRARLGRGDDDRTIGSRAPPSGSTAPPSSPRHAHPGRAGSSGRAGAPRSSRRAASGRRAPPGSRCRGSGQEVAPVDSIRHRFSFRTGPEAGSKRSTPSDAVWLKGCGNEASEGLVGPGAFGVGGRAGAEEEAAFLK